MTLGPRSNAVLGRGSLVVAIATLSCCGTGGPDGYEPGEERTGGDTTVFETGRDAFSLSARNLHDERRDQFFVGNSFFNRGWVTAPSSTTGVDGLGPTYNATSCSSCHFHDGRGAPPSTAGEDFVALLVRLSIPGVDEHGGPLPDPTYGGQLNHHAILGVPAEGTCAVEYLDVPGAFGDGTAYSLARPSYTFRSRSRPVRRGCDVLAARRARDDRPRVCSRRSPRTRSVALADQDDADGDGISGRPNYVYDATSDAMRIGRFGWKANQPSLAQQSAGAFLGDMGITSSLFSEENCPTPQSDCNAAPSGGAPEIEDDKLDAVVYYAHFLAVPGRRDAEDPEVLRGKALFADAGCAVVPRGALRHGDARRLPRALRPRDPPVHRPPAPRHG